MISMAPRISSDTYRRRGNFCPIFFHREGSNLRTSCSNTAPERGGWWCGRVLATPCGVSSRSTTPRVIEAAERNLHTWRGRLRCQDIAFIWSDARVFDVPDDVSIIYLYNPFLGATFVEVLAKICASLARRPRRLTIVYLVPFMHDALVEAGFAVLQSHEDLYYPWTIYVAEGDPTPSGP